MDETTLTATLRSLALEPVLHTSPSADARARGRRIQRDRLLGAAGLVLIVGVVVGGVTLPRGADPATQPGSSGRDWQRQLAEPSFPNHATSQTVVVLDSDKGSVLFVAYWQGKHLCTATVTSGVVRRSECASVTASPSNAITLADIGRGTVYASVTENVSVVRQTTTDGKVVALHPMGGDRFPYRVVVATGKVASLRGYDANGHQVGDAVAGPDGLRLAEVKMSTECAALDVSPRPTSVLSDSSGRYCYQLEPTAMSFVPKAAQAEYDPDQGYLVQVSLAERDRAAFGQLTRQVAAAVAPRNRLAIVWNDKVISAPTILQQIDGPDFQITAGGDAPFTKAEVQELASALGG